MCPTAEACPEPDMSSHVGCTLQQTVPVMNALRCTVALLLCRGNHGAAMAGPCTRRRFILVPDLVGSLQVENQVEQGRPASSFYPILSECWPRSSYRAG